MGQFFNFNSFLLTALIFEALIAWYFLRRGLDRANLFRWLVVAVLIAVGFFSLRPSENSGLETADITAEIGQGVPVLIEFKSPN